MDFTTLSFKPNPLLSSSSPLPKLPRSPLLFIHRRPTRVSRQRPPFRVQAASNPNGSDGFSWQSLSRSVRFGSERFWSKFGESVKKETGFNLGNVNEFAGRVGEGVKAGENELERLRNGVFVEFLNWNKLERWKDLKSWDAKRIAALALYTVVAVISCRAIYSSIRAPYINQQKKELSEAFMEALIPEPTPTNVKKLKKGIWRNTNPKGLKMKKFVERPDGTVVHDSSFVGEDAWDDDADEKLKKILDSNTKLSAKEKKEIEKELGITGESQDGGGTWRERLKKWNEILEKEKFSEQIDSANAKYAVEFDMKEVENSLRKEVVEKSREAPGTRALWIQKRWWRYRPKLPYTYFLQKLDSSEVAAVVFTEDLKRVYVTMKEGFPLEYIVDIPLDPYLFETITSAGVELDVIQKTQAHYIMKVVISILPGILILWFVRESAMLLLITTRRFLYKKYMQLYDMAYSDNFILPIGDGETKEMYKDVVLGGDVWDLIDELMIYMENPMQYYERGVQFVRGVLLSGPPGTGKTLFARTLAQQSGIPFVFASGAEFSDSETSGVARLNRIFSTARRNAPAFVFIDEIDAIAGRHARNDPRRRALFEALIGQLDGDKERIGVDRHSLRQAVIFLCATNRPDELDLEFLRLGRIDRRLYIGLPDSKQRIDIFGVHSSGKQLGEDVDFGKLVFRTVGFSGADIRNLVNEAAIMSVRKGHSKISQQDLLDVLDKQLLEGMGVLLTEEEQQKCEANVSVEKKRLLAVHEAGHIVLAHLFLNYDWHAFSQLLPGGKETAVSVFFPQENMVDQGYTTFGYMMMQMIVAHGGRCAERIVFGDITDGGADDLEKITKIAREMVISPQNRKLGLLHLTKRIGLADRPDNPDGELIRYRWDDPQVIPNKMSPEIGEMFTRELTRYIEETEERAMNALKNNRHILDIVTTELLQNSRITGLEVDDLMKGLSPVMFEDYVAPNHINVEEDGPLPHNDKLRYESVDLYPAPLHRC